MFVAKLKDHDNTYVKDWKGKTYHHLLMCAVGNSNLFTKDLQEARLFKTKSAALSSLRFHWDRTSPVSQDMWYFPRNLEIVHVNILIIRSK